MLQEDQLLLDEFDNVNDKMQHHVKACRNFMQSTASSFEQPIMV